MFGFMPVGSGKSYFCLGKLFNKLMIHITNLFFLCSSKNFNLYRNQNQLIIVCLNIAVQLEILYFLVFLFIQGVKKVKQNFTSLQ